MRDRKNGGRKKRKSFVGLVAWRSLRKRLNYREKSFETAVGCETC